MPATRRYPSHFFPPWKPRPKPPLELVVIYSYADLANGRSCLFPIHGPYFSELRLAASTRDPPSFRLHERYPLIRYYSQSHPPLCKSDPRHVGPQEIPSTFFVLFIRPRRQMARPTLPHLKEVACVLYYSGSILCTPVFWHIPSRQWARCEARCILAFSSSMMEVYIGLSGPNTVPKKENMVVALSRHREGCTRYLV